MFQLLRFRAFKLLKNAIDAGTSSPTFSSYFTKSFVELIVRRSFQLTGSQEIKSFLGASSMKIKYVTVEISRLQSAMNTKETV